MSKELIVSSGRHETRVAILEDDQVVELFHEREKEYSLAGSIHKGRVTRVLPGMQSAFVDIGLERDAFLYVSDFFEDNEEYEAVVSTVEDKVLKMEKGGEVAPVKPAVANPAESPEPESTADEAQEITAVSVPDRKDQLPREGRPERTDRDGERGRGRRGRRRRNGRGGLPESKFFSPGAEKQQRSGHQPESEPQSTPLTKTASMGASRGDEFMVLPGESLAKYSPTEPGDSEEAATESTPALSNDGAVETAGTSIFSATVQPEDPESPPVEPALPPEHPFAGFGAAAALVSQEEAPEQTPAPANAPAVVGIRSEESPARDLGSEGEGEGLSAAEVAEAEVAHEAAVAVLLDSPESEEGPEPARIPTSLTATLREQGHRYPHRVSRRMRRRMRGQQPEDKTREQRPEEKTAEQQLEDGEKERIETLPQNDTRIVTTLHGEGRNELKPGKDRKERERPLLASISDLLKEGQEIIVQIAKEPLGQKGARITSHIALPGRFVVYMPTVEHVGVSRKIPSDDERQRLKRILQTHRQGIPGGFICRTAAESKSEEELKSDMHFLYNLWLDMRQKAEKRPAPVLLHHDLDLVQRILRDQLTTSFKTIWVDNEELYESVLRFVERFQPALVGRVKLYTRANPIFDEFGITSEVEKALRPKVWLKSGGYIVINQTEALVAIDINTGKYVGKSNRLEDTIVRVNTDAIKEIVRQIRLRDLGGIIVVDFIDMDERKNRQRVMVALEDAMRADRAPYKILQFNDFGLVAITRKRVRQSLERTLCAPCPYCEGAGYIKSVATIISEILQEAQRLRKAVEIEHTNLVLRVNPEVARVLKSNQNSYLQEIEEILGKTVLVKSDPLLHQTKFDLA